MSSVVILKEGLLLKSKEQKRRSWKERWVVLTSGALFYYRKKTVCIPLTSCICGVGKVINSLPRIELQSYWHARLEVVSVR